MKRQNNLNKVFLVFRGVFSTIKISTMELFCENSSQKSCIVDVQLGSKYTYGICIVDLFLFLISE